MESGRRSSASAAADDLRPQDHARSPAVGVVVDGPVAARGPSGAGRARGRSRGRAPGCAPGCSPPSGPSTIGGKRVRTSTSSAIRRPRSGGVAGAFGFGGSGRAGPGAFGGRPRAAGLRTGPGALRRLGRALGLRLLLRAAVARPDVVLVVHGSRVHVQRVHVHDHLAALGRELGDDPLHARDVELAARAAHDEHLRAPGAVDLLDRAELLAGRRADGQAHQLVEEPAAGLALLDRRVDLEVHVAERLRGLRGWGSRGSAATSRGRRRRPRPRRWSASGPVPSR